MFLKYDMRYSITSDRFISPRKHLQLVSFNVEFQNRNTRPGQDFI